MDSNRPMPSLPSWAHTSVIICGLTASTAPSAATGWSTTEMPAYRSAGRLAAASGSTTATSPGPPSAGQETAEQGLAIFPPPTTRASSWSEGDRDCAPEGRSEVAAGRGEEDRLQPDSTTSGAPSLDATRCAGAAMIAKGSETSKNPVVTVASGRCLRTGSGRGRCTWPVGSTAFVGVERPQDRSARRRPRHGPERALRNTASRCR